MLDAKNDIVVADECNQVVRFYPPPYKDESATLSAALVTPTRTIATGINGQVFDVAVGAAPR